MKHRLAQIISSQAFSNFILLVVLINSIVLGLLTSPSIVAFCGPILYTIDKICLYIFIAEAVLKISVLRVEYFKSGWNIFDFLIVLSSVVSSFPALSSFRILRIIRVFRALKFISGVKHLQTIVLAIGKSIPSISWTALLIALVYYIYAIIGTLLFGENFPDWFGSINRSMYSLFQVMTLESWSMGISRPVMNIFPYAWIYFISFVIVSSFVMLNFIVGIVVNSICEVSAQRENGEKKKIVEATPLEELEIIRCRLKKLEESLEKNH